ncbi:VOC family protein [Ectobacillus panaciterrae]|uniref:VOC family protein n=1 Tax=Ectobacillus panaciterrae TaxID=363872 RepID=UPI000414F82E|nr:VOC family protein [Ectobacillus panaciterrae]
MATITTYIISEDSRTQAEFYIQALGGKIKSVMTHGQLPDANDKLKDKVLHMEFVAGSVDFFMTDSYFSLFFHGNTIIRGNNISLNLAFQTEEEAHEAFEKLSQGGKINKPLEQAFWGGLHGELEDKFGVIWMITNVPGN